MEETPAPHFDPGRMTRRGLLQAGGTAAAAAYLAPVAFGARPRVHRRTAPGVVEAHLVAEPRSVRLANGSKTAMWTYNGSVPGPLIEANVGDTLVVHLTNRLPEPTTIHWHGVEVPATMDGSNISQLPVPPGGTYRYEFDLLRPALYWYHPHLNTNVQVERGLAGPLLVRDPGEERLLGLDDEFYYAGDQVLVLDDILLDERGRIEAFATDPDADIEPAERAERLLNGREGNLLLVNGEPRPTFKVRPGVPIRWRMVNTASARFMRVSVPAHTLHRIGGDGGLLEHPIPVPPVGTVADPMRGGEMSDPDPDKGVLLVPGERADVILVPRGRPGDRLAVQWHDFPRGRHHTEVADDGSVVLDHAHDDGRRPPIALFELKFQGRGRPRRGGAYRPPANLREIERLDRAGAPPLAVPFGHTMPDRQGHVTFFNATRMEMTPDGPHMVGIPFPDVTPADAHDVEVGGTYMWEAVNMTGGDHPFHAHGFFFQPLEIEYVDMDDPAASRVVPFDHVEDKDSLRLPARPGARMRSRTILRALVRFDDTGREGRVEAFGKQPGRSRSGGWLVHCHFLEHADAGMMTFVELRAPSG